MKKTNRWFDVLQAVAGYMGAITLLLIGGLNVL